MIGIECDFHTEHAIGITFAFYSRKTALQLLKAVAKVETIPVGTTELIQSVNGTANNQTYRWQLYSGGKAVIGPSSTYMTKAGEQLEWRFESNAE
jgi:hypothetical protein